MTKKEPGRKPRKKAGGPGDTARHSGPPAVRIPLPAKTQKRHGDATKYDRTRQKEMLRRELD